MAKKKGQWVKFRHKVINFLFFPLFFLLSKIKYGIKFVPFKERKRQYLVVSNHQTAYDQFFISILFKKPVYYAASEDLFSKGFVSKLLSFAVAPIPIKKSMTDVRAVMNLARISKEGGTIAIFPEGNRTFSGKTCYLKPGIGGLVKLVKLPVAVVSIEGGYGIQPRFSDKTRKGHMKAYIKQVIEYDEFKNLSDEECYLKIKEAIYHSDFDVHGEYKSKRSAEYVERVVYVCPHCGISKFTSKNTNFRCDNCGLEVEYLSDLSLKGVNKTLPFKNIGEWYDYQEKFISETDLSQYFDKPIYSDTVDFYVTTIYRKPELLIESAKAEVYGNRYEIISAEKTVVLNFDDITATTALGRNRFNIYIGDETYQFRSRPGFNPLIYLNVFYHYKNNLIGGVYDQSVSNRSAGGEFLGL